MASQEEFLKSIRQALAQSRAGVSTPFAPGPPSGDGNAATIAEKARLVRERLPAGRQTALKRLEGMAPLQGWKLVKVTSRAEVAGAVAGLAEALGAKIVVRSAHPVLVEAAVDKALAAKGIQVIPLVHDPAKPETSQAWLREAAARADVGLTGVDYMVAETATAALVSRRGASRLVSLLPPIHIAVVEPEQVVESLDDLLALRQAELPEQGGSPWYMNLISGPSRTADIEQTIVIRVHGPGEVYLVLVTGESESSRA